MATGVGQRIAVAPWRDVTIAITSLHAEPLMCTVPQTRRHTHTHLHTQINEAIS